MSSIVVKSLKYDGSLHRGWEAVLVEARDNLLIVEGSFREEVRHKLLGTIHAGTVSREYFWTDRWYSVFRFGSASGDLLSFYCNINTPVKYDSETISFIDLDIDVLVSPDYSYRVLDEDEFVAHSTLYGYTLETRRGAREGLEEVLRLIRTRKFPFDEDENRRIESAAT